MKTDIVNSVVLVAPLDWGLGHACRCVPIIKELLLNNNKVILGITPLTDQIFKEEFPQLERLDLPSYAISYSTRYSLLVKLIFQIPKIKRVVKEENKLLSAKMKTLKLNVVISDNRYGLYHPAIKSIIVCHQLTLKVPVFSKIVNAIHAKMLNRFAEVWVPDYKSESQYLAGELSRSRYIKNMRYIEPLSRLKSTDTITHLELDYLFLLSGPEPNQSKLAYAILEQANKFDIKKSALITSSKINVDSQYSTLIYQLPSKIQISELISKSKLIVCRSGYSTLMDLHLLKKEKLILIPTKGQTEQEYLAEYWKQKFKIKVVEEDNLNQLFEQ